MGAIQSEHQRWQLVDFPQDRRAESVANLVIQHNDGSLLRLSSVARVTESVQDVRTFGSSNGKPAVLLIIYRQPSANIITVVDHVKAVLPQINALLPPTANLALMMDRTTTIRASVQDEQETLLVSVLLVSLVLWVVRVVVALTWHKQVVQMLRHCRACLPLQKKSYWRGCLNFAISLNNSN
jgi:multidrug efflux pump